MATISGPQALALLDQDAVDVFAAFQNRQDVQVTWGQALESARKAIA